MDRREDLDSAKGLAILLVVFGHIVARADPVGVGWYEPVRRGIYSFHMPFFLYLSGMAAVWAGGIFGSPGSWGRFAAGRARRLLVPFFGMGAVILVGKVAVGGVMFVDNAPVGIWRGFLGLVWWTEDSPARSIWYAYVLFWYVVVAAPLLWVGRGRVWVMGMVFGALFLVPFPAVMYADELGRYGLFFVMGVSAGMAGPGWTGFVDEWWRWLGVVLGGVLAWVVWFGDFVSFPVTLLVAGSLSMPVLHGLVRSLGDGWARVFLWLGRYSFMIYLFNTLFIGLAKGLLLRVTGWDGGHFWGFAVALTLSGLLGPVALKEVAFRRAGVLDRLTN